MRFTKVVRLTLFFLLLGAFLTISFFVTSRIGAQEVSYVSWTDDIQPTIEKTESLTQAEYDQRTSSGYTNFTCKTETVYTSVLASQTTGSPPQKTAIPAQGCTILGATGKYEWNTQSVIPYGTDYIQRLDDPSLSRTFYFGAKNTNTIAVFSNAYQFFYGGTPTLHIARDWSSTFADFTVDSHLNVTRHRSQDYDFVLKNSVGEPVDARPNGLSFSANGKWMTAAVTGVSRIVINLDTFEVTPYASHDNSTFAMYSSVSNDGRYVATSRPSGGGLKIYDLEKCQAPAGEFVSRDCQDKDVYEFLKNYLHTADLRVRDLNFIGANNMLDVLAESQNSDGSWERGVYRMHLPDATPEKYLALGDSFSSGEGAYNYRSPTDFYIDESEYNLCHQSRNSYPYVIQSNLQFSWFNSVACSGAKVKDVQYSGADALKYLNDNKSQAKTAHVVSRSLVNNYLKSYAPGYIPQKEFVLDHKPSFVTLSIGGNDIGFGDIISSCIINQHQETLLDQICFDEREERERLANQIDQKISIMATTFRTIKNSMGGSDPKLYVVGYPQIIKPEGACEGNTPFIESERYAAVALTDYINAAVKVAADAAGVRYVDMTNAFIDESGDYRLCSDKPELAVNGLVVLGKSSRKADQTVYYSESFHPNELGQSMMAQTVLAQTANLTQTMPSTKDSTENLQQKRINFVGDNEIRHQNYQITYQKDIVPAIAVKGQPVTINSPAVDGELPTQPGTDATATAHSTPRELGHLPISSDGSVRGAVIVPADLETGYHKIIISFTDIAGNTVERYAYVYVAASPDDWDGDGTANAADACSITWPSGSDRDGDGIDDVCDGEYSKATVEQAPAAHGPSAAVPFVANSQQQMSSRGTSYLTQQEVVIGDDVRSSDVLSAISSPEQETRENSTQSNDTRKAEDNNGNNRIFVLIPTLLIVAGAVAFVLRRSLQKRS